MSIKYRLFFNLNQPNLNPKFRAYRKLITPLKSPAGRSKQGRLLLRRSAKQTLYWSKTLLSTRWFINHVGLLFKSSAFSFKTSASFMSFTVGAAGLVKTHVTLHNNLFMLTLSDRRGLTKTTLKLTPSNLLLFTKINTKVSQIRDVFNQTALFATAAGSFAIIQSFDRLSGFLRILLPSSAYKLFFFLSRFEIAFARNSNFVNTNYSPSNSLKNLLKFKAGSLKQFGYRPKVRGVAMNPVDHPHGGRTKSIKLHRTPWGLVTKRK